MKRSAAYSVKSLYRYPVKSMAGEERPTADVTTVGVLGDRAYALVDRASNKVASVRTWAAGLLNYRAQFLAEPENGAPVPGVQITLPTGEIVTTVQADIHRRLSAALGRELTITASAPPGLLLELPPGTLSGAYAQVTEAPLAGGASPGTFFDYGTIHLVATSTLDRLQALHPEGRVDIRRFRPNMVINTNDSDPFIENGWAGHILALGDEVQLRVTIPCPRCVVITLPQAELPHDPGILRTVAQQNRRDLGDFGMLPCVGAYADVLQAGTVRRGDVVRVVE